MVNFMLCVFYQKKQQKRNMCISYTLTYKTSSLLQRLSLSPSIHGFLPPAYGSTSAFIFQ